MVSQLLPGGKGILSWMDRDIMCCLSQQCFIGVINSNSPSGSSPGDGKLPTGSTLPAETPWVTGMGSEGEQDTAQSDVSGSIAVFVHSPCSTPCSGKDILV